MARPGTATRSGRAKATQAALINRRTEGIKRLRCGQIISLVARGAEPARIRLNAVRLIGWDFEQ
jgi:hypothetical protein